MQRKWTMSLLFVGLLCIPKSTRAQKSADAQQAAIRKLQARMDQLQTELTAIRSDLEALHGGKVPATGAIESIPPTSPPTPHISPEQQLEAAGHETQEHQTFEADEEDAPRLDNAPQEPNYPGFFQLPGTHTLMRLDGSARTDLLVDPTVRGLPDSFVPSSIPIPSAGPGQFAASIRATRFSADFRTPLGDLGSARALIQFDLFAANGVTAPRLLHFYGQLDNILVGQTFSNLMDPDALPDSLDYPGVNAGIFVFVPQARYSFGLGKGWSDSISIEQPATNISFSVHGMPVQAFTRSPDGSMRLRKEWETGHFQVAGIFRDLSFRVPNGGPQQSVFGWGVNATAGTETFRKDNIVLGLLYGHGIARYVRETVGLNLDAALRSQTDLSLLALPLFATYGSYQHYWSQAVRSNATFGFVRIGNTAFQSANTYHNSMYASANLIWNPVGSMDVGAEFLYGWVQNKSGATASAPRIQLTGRYRFVRHHEE